MPRRKTWREKLADSKGLPEVKPIEGKMSTRWGTGTVAIPAPVEVDALMRKVPRGRLATINELRAAIAQKHGATIGCPICTGIFAWIAAHAAAEAAAEGEKNITPYWRTLKVGGELNPKYPGGIEDIRRRLEAEGHRVIAKGKRFVVADYAARLIAQDGGPKGQEVADGKAHAVVRHVADSGPGRRRGGLRGRGKGPGLARHGDGPMTARGRSSVAAVVVWALFLASLITAFTQPSLIDAARAECVARGWPADDLSVQSYRESGRMSTRRGVIQFWVSGGPAGKIVRVEMSRPVYFLPWKLKDIREGREVD